MRAKLGLDFAVQTCEHSTNHITDITDTRYQTHKHLHTLQSIAFPYGVRLALFVLPYGVRLVRFVSLCGMRLVLW